MNEIASKTQFRPRVFVGAPTGSLNPQIPSPVHRPSPIAIEIADGIGFGIDGETLVVDDGGGRLQQGRLRISGHLEDGTYPQRDFVITHDGADTKIDGYYDWQEYTLHRDRNVLHINGQTEAESSTVTQTVDSTVVDGKYHAQRFYIGEAHNSNIVTVDGYDGSVSAQIVFGEDHISIRSDIPERCFEITKTDDGFHVQGALRTQDFDVRKTGEGFVVSGLYPQQKYVVKKG